MRFLGLIGLLGLVGSGWAQEPKKVSYETVAKAATLALKELGDKAGVPLVVAPAMTEHTLVIRVSDVPLNEVLKRVAQVTWGKWETYGGGYRLVSDPVLERERAQVLRTKQAAILARQIAKKGVEVKALPAFDLNVAKKLAQEAMKLSVEAQADEPNNSLWTRIAEVDQSSPAGRLISSVLASLDPKELLAIPNGERVVYSTQPNRMQRRLNTAIGPALATFAREQNTWAAATEQAFPKDFEQSGGYYVGAIQNRKRLGTIGKTLMMVKHDAYGAYVVRVVVVDGKGKIMAQTGDQISANWDEDVAKEFQAVKPDPNEKPIELRPVSKELAKVIREYADWGPERKSGVPTLSAELKEGLLNPEKIDPLAYGASDMLLAYSRANKNNMVADVPDYMFGLNVEDMGMPVRPSNFLRFLKSMDMDVEAKDGWFTFRSGGSAGFDAMRIARPALGRLLRSVVKNGRLTLDEAAAYALGAQDEDFVAATYLGLFDPHAMQILASNPRPLLKFYGAMTTNQRQAAKTGKPFGIGQVTAFQRGIIEKMVYADENSGPMRLSAEAEPGSPDEDFDPGNSLQSEPTERLPNGLPSDTVITLTMADEQVIMSADPRESGEGIYMEATEMGVPEIAWHLFAQERPDIFPWMSTRGQKMTFEKVRTGTRTTISFEFKFTPKMALTNQLKDVAFGAEAIPYAQLPEDVRKKIQEARDEMVKQYKDVKPGDYSGPTRKNPPPPPLR